MWPGSPTRRTLKKDLAHSYNFYPYNIKCTGHTKLKATTGHEYEYDLAGSVYCSCGRPTIKADSSVEEPASYMVLNPALSKGSTILINQANLKQEEIPRRKSRKRKIKIVILILTILAKIKTSVRLLPHQISNQHSSLPLLLELLLW
jgi:hypothetical protein